MKQIILSLLLLSLAGHIPVNAQADSSKTNSATIAALSRKTDSLSKKIDSLNDSIKVVKTILDGELTVDQTYLDSVMRHPKELLYDQTVYAKNHTPGSVINLIVAILLLLFMWVKGTQYLYRENLCRDMSFDKNGKLRTDIENIPFSYARVQLFWWSMIILSCYIVFYGLTSHLLPLNPTSVILLGCGIAVTTGGKIIDNRQIATNGFGERHQDQRSADPVIRKANLFRDILSDDNGISMHRFQAVVFNLVFGIAYVSTFIRSIYLSKYPLVEFNEWQFAMIGISSAGYLAMKANENDPGKQNTPNADTSNTNSDQQDLVVPDEAGFSNTPAQG